MGELAGRYSSRREYILNFSWQLSAGVAIFLCYLWPISAAHKTLLQTQRGTQVILSEHWWRVESVLKKCNTLEMEHVPRNAGVHSELWESAADHEHHYGQQ